MPSNVYNSILLGDLSSARIEIEEVLALVDTYAQHAAHFFVYSTYGEFFLAQKSWSEAEHWFKRVLTEITQREDTDFQAAELYANLGRVAWN